MLKIKFFKVGIDHLVERYYLMMAGIIVLGFLNHFILAAIWAMILALSCVLGISFQLTGEKDIKKQEGRIVPVGSDRIIKKAA